MDNKAKKIFNDYDAAKEERDAWKPHWQEKADYIYPDKSSIVSKKPKGTKRTVQIFDSTAPNSAADLASFMGGSMMSKKFIWAYLNLKNAQLGMEDLQWLDASTKIFHQALQFSNFYAKRDELFIDLIVQCTDCLFIGEKKGSYKFNGFYFDAIPVPDFVIMFDAEGNLNTIWVELELTAAAAVEKWENNAGDKVVKAADKFPSEKFKFLHYVAPRLMRNKRSKRATDKPFESYYLSDTDKSIIEEGGYTEFPYCVSRWSGSPGENYGRGRSDIALPAVRTLNKAQELFLKGWAKMIDPPLIKRESGTIGKITGVPAGINVVRDDNALKTMDLHIDLRSNFIGIEALQNDIRRAFYMDRINIPDSPEKTAYEIYTRMELMQQIMGPVLDRQEVEKLNPLVERCFGLLLRGGAFPPPTPGVMDYLRRYGRLDIEYESPLARAQRSAEVVAVRRYYEMAIPMAQYAPEVLDEINPAKVAKEMADTLGVSPSVRNTDKEKQEIKAQREEVARQQMQAQKMMQMAQGAGQAAPALQAVQGMMKESGGNLSLPGMGGGEDVRLSGDIQEMLLGETG